MLLNKEMLEGHVQSLKTLINAVFKIVQEMLEGHIQSLKTLINAVFKIEQTFCL